MFFSANIPCLLFVMRKNMRQIKTALQNNATNGDTAARNMEKGSQSGLTLKKLTALHGFVLKILVRDWRRQALPAYANLKVKRFSGQNKTALGAVLFCVPCRLFLPCRSISLFYFFIFLAALRLAFRISYPAMPGFVISSGCRMVSISSLVSSFSRRSNSRTGLPVEIASFAIMAEAS